MEIINRKHREIKFRKSETRHKPYVKFMSKEVFFSVRLVEALGMTPGMFVHFIDEKDGWHLYVDNNEDGFQLQQRGSKKTLSIYSSALVVLFQKRTKITTLPIRFPIQATSATVGTSVIYKVLLNEPFEEE